MANTSKIVKYTNRDFDSLKSSLINFSKTYFPSTYNDFTPTSTGMLFMEMSAYVGDILSFYLDNQLQENFIQYARQTENVYNLAYMLGYKPRVSSAASTEIEFFQQLPSKIVNGAYVPDFSYALKVPTNTSVTPSDGSVSTFITETELDFSFSGSLDNTEITVYSLSGNNPDFYLVKKKRKAISATVNTITFDFASPKKFDTRVIDAENILGILDVFDSQGNQWYEVDNLAQDGVFDSIKNTTVNDPTSVQGDALNLLKFKRTQKRFTSRFIDQNTYQLSFGAGTVSDKDEDVVPNPDNVGIGLPFMKDKMTTAFSPTNFMFTDTYGVAPADTTLTVRYLTGGGLSSNVDSNVLNILDTDNVTFVNSQNLNSTTAQVVFDSIACNNPQRADGGQGPDTLNEIRQNALGNFQGQLRTVTQEDYVIRALSLPGEFGTIAKAYATPSLKTTFSLGVTPTVLDLYVLTYDGNKKLQVASKTLKDNLRTYLGAYRMINDSISIRDGFIINIGVDYDILVRPNYNSNAVIQACNNSLIDYFNIDKWSINQPILLKELSILLDKVDGVQTVTNVEIINKTGLSLGYSKYAYDIKAATSKGIVYPSMDPCIFEVKNPTVDIRGRSTK